MLNSFVGDAGWEPNPEVSIESGRAEAWDTSYERKRQDIQWVADCKEKTATIEISRTQAGRYVLVRSQINRLLF